MTLWSWVCKDLIPDTTSSTEISFKHLETYPAISFSHFSSSNAGVTSRRFQNNPFLFILLLSLIRSICHDSLRLRERHTACHGAAKSSISQCQTMLMHSELRSATPYMTGHQCLTTEISSLVNIFRFSLHVLSSLAPCTKQNSCSFLLFSLLTVKMCVFM